MASGGARARSGPGADPNALRRDRPGDAAWITLPAEGFQGDIPAWPFSSSTDDEPFLWAELWRKPQAVMWDKLGLQHQVAAYARAFLESVEAGASAGLKTAVLRMEGELGLSIPGLGQLRWKFAEDELAAKRDAVKPAASSARTRLAALADS